MPIYEYACKKCRKQHEVMQKITDKPLTKCPECGGSMKKMISNTSFVLKGSGWYATDYAPKKKEGKEKTGKSSKEHGLTAESRKSEEKKTTAEPEKKSGPKEAAS